MRGSRIFSNPVTYEALYSLLSSITLTLAVSTFNLWPGQQDRAHLHIKFCLFFELQFAMTYTSLKLCYWNFHAVLIKQLESRWRLQTMFIINSDQEKYHFLSMCNLCRCAWSLQAIIIITKPVISYLTQTTEMEKKKQLHNPATLLHPLLHKF